LVVASTGAAALSTVALLKRNPLGRRRIDSGEQLKRGIELSELAELLRSH